jgi:PmbA protein
MDFLQLAEKLVKKSISLGAHSSEVYLQKVRNLSVNVLNSEIETIEESYSQGAGFRVFVDGKMGFSHCNDFADKSLEDTISRAIAFARLSSPDENNVLTGDKGITDVGELLIPVSGSLHG